MICKSGLENTSTIFYQILCFAHTLTCKPESKLYIENKTFLQLVKLIVIQYFQYLESGITTKAELLQHLAALDNISHV